MGIAGNGPGALGVPIEPCVSSFGDGNTATADIDFDVFLDGIPGGNPARANNLGGFNYKIGVKPGHSLAGLTVITYAETTAGVNILTNQGTGVILTFSTLPPAPLAGFTTAVTDLGPSETPAITPRGVTTRYGVDVDGAAPGLYPMVLDPPFAMFDSAGAEVIDADDQFSDLTDTDGDTLVDEDNIIDAFDGFGLIAVDTPCPLGADLKKVSLDATLPGPFLPPPFDANDIPVSTSIPVFLTEVLHNNGPETLVATDIEIDCTSPESILVPGTPGGSCSFHVTPDLYLPPYIPGVSLTCPGFLEITINGIPIACDPPPSSVFVATWPDVLDVHKKVNLPASITVPLTEEWDIHCFEPSTHTWRFDNSIQPQSQFVTDTDPTNNSKFATVTADCIAFADIKILTQTMSSSFGTTIIGADGYDNDADTLRDEDGLGDCNGDGNQDDDGDLALNEDGGMCPVIHVAKDIHNNGAWTPVVTNINKVVFPARVLNSITGAVAPLPPRGGVFPGCNLIPLPSDPAQTSLANSVTQTHDEFFVLDCDQRGFTVDDDGDSPEGPGGACNPPYVGLPQCIRWVDEDPPDGIDNDGDTFVDEDGPVSLTVVVALNLITPKDPHVVDVDLGPPCNPFDPNTWAAGLCGNNGTVSTLTITDILPFSPSYTTLEDEVAPDVLAPPVGQDCLITLPCKIQHDYALPGGNPLAAVTLNIPGGIPSAYTLTRSNDLNSIIGSASAIPHLSILSGPCATPFPLVVTLYNAALPFALGPLPFQLPDDTPTASGALGNPYSWSSHFNAWVAIVGLPLHSREMGVAIVAGTPVPLNVLVFDGSLFGLGYFKITLIGDPDDDGDGIIDELDPDDDGDLIPDFADPDFDNDTTLNTAELLTPIPGGSFCTPLSVSILELGVSAANAAPPPPFPPVPGGDTLAVCNLINTAPGHMFVATFQRADIGTKTNVPEFQQCSGENDVEQILKKDEDVGNNVVISADTDGDTIADPPATYRVDNDGDTAVDEDPVDGLDNDLDGHTDEDPANDAPLPVGLTVGVEVGVIIRNGVVPSMVHEDLSIVSRDPCTAQWAIPSPLPAGMQNTVLDPLITVGPTHISVLKWDEGGITPPLMDGPETIVRTIKYMIKCTAPVNPTAPPLQIESNAQSTPFLPDPNPLNNEDMNNPVVRATVLDVDGDGVPNPIDNCPWNANANQLDTDGDGRGDACDLDDDNDGNPDATDNCDTLAEDIDFEADGDGCPETNMSLSVVKDNPIDVDVSENKTFTVTATATNGNYGLFDPYGVIFFELLKSNITDPNNKCEARWIPQPGDFWVENAIWEDWKNSGYTDTNGNTRPDMGEPGVELVLYSQIQRTEFNLSAGNPRNKIRDYTLHCNARSDHEIFLEEGIAPTFPVSDPDVQNNVHKQYIQIEAWDLADIKIIEHKIHSAPTEMRLVEDRDGDSIVDQGAVGRIVVKKVLHNNGPSAARAKITTQAILQVRNAQGNLVPADCTAYLISPTTNPYTVNLPVSVQVNVTEEWDILCRDTSLHHFSFRNVVETDEVHLRDPDLSSNVGDSFVEVPVIGKTDLSLGTTVNAPSSVRVSQNEFFTVQTRITNVGAFGVRPEVWQTMQPVGANAKDCRVSFHFTAAWLATVIGGGLGVVVVRPIDDDGDSLFDEDPVDGLDNDLDSLVDEDPPNPLNPNTPAGWQPSDVVLGDYGGPLSLHYEADLDRHEQYSNIGEWDKHCKAPSFHDFSLDTQTMRNPAKDPHVEFDPDSANSSWREAVLADADLKISSWFFEDADQQLDADSWMVRVRPSDYRVVREKEKLHNNGPFGPVVADKEVRGQATGGCRISYTVQGIETSIIVDGVQRLPLPAGANVITLPGGNMAVMFRDTLPVSVDVWQTEVWDFHIDEHIWQCRVDLTKTLIGVDGHVSDANGASKAIDMTVCADSDLDGVPDNCLGQHDNCPVTANPDQRDSDGDGLGDKCDKSASHQLVVKYCIKIGPAPVNLSDTQGKYLWALCEIGNWSDHDEAVTISLTVSGQPAYCTKFDQRILPGQSTILLKGQFIDNDGDTRINEDPPDGLDNDGDSLIDEDGPDGEQKIILFRVRFECHNGAPGLFPLPVSVCVDHSGSTALDDDGDTLINEDPVDGIDNDGDSQIDEDPADGPVPPDCDNQTEQLIVHQP